MLFLEEKKIRNKDTVPEKHSGQTSDAVMAFDPEEAHDLGARQHPHLCLGQEMVTCLRNVTIKK